MIRFGLVALTLAMLGACGSGDPDVPPPAPADVDTPEIETSNAPGALPPAPETAQDGDTVTAKVGEEFSVSFDLPDGVSTGFGWAPVEGDYAPMLGFRGNSHTFLAEQRYFDIRLEALEAGEISITYALVENGALVADAPRRTVTYLVTE
ncbi:MAG: hypothetical protein MRY64_04310 [Hyphomonadaceae bacterium]|nr:hypothetical protein [Hyphomonadaceae bacterium]